ncbi:unnamed protein product [Cyclocybe aegerita]|uniref:Uncharacterized protein n=1 Tax=Cyclocybe aegerita TaxID=1973307 RepID=A0A8S0W956_CYCAE|nr:unnamed protein product [Cyclocybe aegerita]
MGGGLVSGVYYSFSAPSVASICGSLRSVALVAVLHTIVLDLLSCLSQKSAAGSRIRAVIRFSSGTHRSITPHRQHSLKQPQCPSTNQARTLRPTSRPTMTLLATRPTPPRAPALATYLLEAAVEVEMQDRPCSADPKQLVLAAQGEASPSTNPVECSHDLVSAVYFVLKSRVPI